jgi:hydrogenase expression/formation protein HypC
MCLAVPGKLLDREEHDGLLTGRVDFGGVTRQACLDLVPEAQPGDYVLVHVGFAISRMSEEEAQRTLELIAQTGVFEDEEEGGEEEPSAAGERDDDAVH